jgi:hypothetical protein
MLTKASSANSAHVKRLTEHRLIIERRGSCVQVRPRRDAPLGRTLRYAARMSSPPPLTLYSTCRCDASGCSARYSRTRRRRCFAVWRVSAAAVAWGSGPLPPLLKWSGVARHARYAAISRGVAGRAPARRRVLGGSRPLARPRLDLPLRPSRGYRESNCLRRLRSR